MKKWIAVTLLLALLLSGCGGEPSGETSVPASSEETLGHIIQTDPAQSGEDTGENVTITVWVTAEDIWENSDALNAMLEEFNAYYPNILVNVEYKSPDAVGSDMPDVVLGHGDDLAAWHDRGFLADLSQIWQQRGDDIYAAAEAVSGSKDSRFMMPMCLVVHCMAINRAYFENAQALSLFNAANHTWSTANFLQALQNLSDIGMDEALTIYCEDTLGDVNPRLLASNLYGGSFVNTVNGTYTVNSANLYRALQTLNSQMGVVFDETQTGEEALAQFLAGNTAMVLNWSSALHLQHGQDENIFFMNYPSTGKAKTYAEVYGLGVFAGDDATQVAASLTFVNHVSGSDAAARATGQLPARKSAGDVYEDTELEEIMTDLNRLLTYMTEGEIPGREWEKAREEWTDMLRKIAAGEDVKTAVDACQNNLDTLLGVQ